MEKIERDTSLTRLGIMAKRHWEKWRPKMVVRLKEGEVYQDAILMAQNTAKEELVRRVSAGIPYHMAWEYVQ